MRAPSVVTWLQYPLRAEKSHLLGRTPSTFLFRAESELGMQAAERRGGQGKEGLCAGNPGVEGNAGVGFKRLWWRRDQTGTEFTCFISTKGTQFTCVIGTKRLKKLWWWGDRPDWYEIYLLRCNKKYKN
jgi:hypothetical protein